MAEKTPSFDLASLSTRKACDTPIMVTLRHPATQEPLPVRIPILGPDSAVFQGVMRQQINAKLRTAELAKRRGKDPEVPTVEKAEEEAVELMTACIYGASDAGMKWEGVELEGAPLDFTVPNIKKLLTYPGLEWIRKQMDEPLGDLGLFMKS